ncbi:adhesive plaque matrix protein-like [Palaemon carinicauda]|uniref:adhesive plaque matrix protein-like n=1 Tax=Palaemon carinicauda TaxID=392227 RepID=UPI0035B66654
MRRARASPPGGVCLLTLLMSAIIVSTDAKTARPSYFPTYDYDEPYQLSRDAEEKSGHLPIAPHYPSHGRPPKYHGPEPDFYGRPSHHAPATSIDFSEQDFSYDTPLYRDAYDPPVYRPKPQYDEPEYEPQSPAYAEPDVKRKPSYKEPVHKPRPSNEEPAYKPRPTYEEPAYKPRPTYEEPAYKPRPAYDEPAYKPKPAYQEPAYKPKPAYREPAHKPRPAYEEPQGYSKPKTAYQDQSDQHHKSYDSKNTIPGEAGVDYPIYDKIPITKFTCDSVPYRPGMYANPEASCQVYHVCNDDRYGSRGAEFLCTNGTIFNQQTFSCDWWYNVDCSKATEYYALNSDPEHNPYYQKPEEPKESEYKADPKPRVSPTYHKPEPSYHKPRPTYRPQTAKPVYHQTPKPSYRATTLKPSYRQTPEPAYHVTTAKPSYRTPSPSAAYRSPVPAYSRPEPAHHRPEPSYRTPSPSYRRPVRRPTPESREPSYQEKDLEAFYNVGEDGEVEFGPDFEWGARF